MSPMPCERSQDMAIDHTERSQKKVYAEQLQNTDGIVDEFVCKICLVHVVGCSPKLTKCSHLFCGDCMDQWLVSNPSNQTWAQRARSCGEVPCPACKAPLRKDTDLFPIGNGDCDNSDLLWRMIQALDIKCAHKNCRWRGTYGEYWTHLECGACGYGDFAAASVEADTASCDEDKLSSSPGTTTGSPTSSPAELSADEMDIIELLPVAEQASNFVNDPVVEQASNYRSDPVECEHYPTEDSGADLSSLIRALLELKTSGDPAPLQTSSDEGGKPVEFEVVSKVPQTAGDIAPLRTSSDEGCKPVKLEVVSKVLHTSVRPALAPSVKKNKATKPVAARAEARQAAHPQQSQAMQWQAHARMQQMHAAQWQAYTAYSLQCRMAAAQTAHVQQMQMARYQQMLHHAANSAC